LGIEVAQSNNGIFISQRKYELDILEETKLMNSKFVDTPMDPIVKLLSSLGEPFLDSEKYKILVGKLNHLIVTPSDIYISFAVSVVSQFLNFPCVNHWNAIIHILKYIKGSSGNDLSYGHNTHSRVVCYSDSDWVGYSFDRRSTFG